MKFFRGLLDMYSKISPRKPSLPPYGHVAQLGDPVLRKSAEEILPSLIKSHETTKTIKAIKSVMDQYGSCGLAAPQIGVNKRVIGIQFHEYHKRLNKDIFEKQEMALLKLTIIINPKIKVLSYKKVSFLESCESVKGFTAEVPRYHQIMLSGYNEEAEKIQLQLKGWLARIAQHEVDHLDGKFFIDSMITDTFHCTCWKEVNEYHGKVTLPFYPS